MNCFRSLPDYKTDYDRALGDKQKAIISRIDGTAHDLELFLELVLISSEGDMPLIINTSRNLLSKLQITRRYLDIDFSSLRRTDDELYENLPQYPILPRTTESCAQSRDNIRRLPVFFNETLVKLNKLLNASSVEMSLRDLPTYEQLLRSLKDFSSTFSLCYGAYRRQLDTLVDWFQSLTLVNTEETVMDVSFELDIDVCMCSVDQALSHRFS